jgi:hypothetical protein
VAVAGWLAYWFYFRHEKAAKRPKDS